MAATPEVLEHRRRVRAALDEAIALAAEDRERFLQALAAEDSAIVVEVATLLAATHESETSPAAAASLTADPWLGRVLGSAEAGWRLEAVLGDGGSGRVYRATRVHDGRAAAVKLLRPDRATPVGLARLRSELAATRRIEHPGVVPVIAASSDEADPSGGEAGSEAAWIAFELVPGARWITEHALDMPEGDVGAVLRLLLEVSDALAAAHAAGVVHRDLKPSNLLVGADGRPRVIDFGIARILDLQGEGPTILAERTREGLVVGTPAYMAPEQVDPRLGAVSPRTDVHALGVLAFRLLSGRMPFETGGNLLAAAQAIRYVPPRSLTALAPEVPAAVEAVLVAAMSKEPEGRPADAGAFAARLREAIDPAPQPPTTGRWWSRGRGTTVAAFVLPLLLAAGWMFGRGGGGGGGGGDAGPSPRDAPPAAAADWTMPVHVVFEEPSRPAVPGGRTLRVPAEYATIQAAFDAAADGDLVLIAPGTYRESLDTLGKSIEVRGEARAAEVVLQSPDGEGILTVADARPLRIAFRDLTFTGSATQRAVDCSAAGVIFERCIFRDNAAGGLRHESVAEAECERGAVSRFSDCLFLENGSHMAGGVLLIHRSARFERCGFIANETLMPPRDPARAAGGGLYYSTWNCGEHTLEISDCIFAGNRAEWGGAIYAEGDQRPVELQPTASIERTVFYANDAEEGPVAWPSSIRLSVRDSVLGGGGELIARQWIDGGGNRFEPGVAEPPYDDADGDLVPDRLQELLGLPTRVRERIMFEEPSRPAPGGRTLRVPGDLPSIQAAIDAAADGDLVLIAPGTYRESLRMLGKAIELRGEGRAARIVLESPDGGPVVDGSNTGRSRPVFRDLTFTGSETERAVLLRGAEAIFERCVFRDNFGGGIALAPNGCSEGVGSHVLDCLFLDNAGTEAAGFYAAMSSIVVDGCAFVGNRADLSTVTTDSRGAGGGIYYSDWECGLNRPLIRNTVFAGNIAQWGAAIYAEGDFQPKDLRPVLEVDSSIFFANRADEGEAAWPWSIRLEVSRSAICGDGDLFHGDWTDAGENAIRPACMQPPYDDADGDLVPDRLQRLLGVPTRPRIRSNFFMPSQPSGDGKTIRVPEDAASVQAAIDAAEGGDLILLAPGEYAERIDPGGKAIEIRGDGQAAEVILRSPDGGPVLELSSGETPATIFRDLSFTGAVRRPAVAFRGAAATFERCIFRDNLAGAARHEASPDRPVAASRYVDCVFHRNVAAEGGGLWIDRQSVSLDGCSFVENRAAGEASEAAGGGRGGAIRFRGPESGEVELALRACRFDRNTADRGGAIHATGSPAGDGAWSRIRTNACWFGPNPVGGAGLPPPSPGFPSSPSRRPAPGPGDLGEAVDAEGVELEIRRTWFCGGEIMVRAERRSDYQNRFDEQCDRQAHAADWDGDGIPDILERRLGMVVAPSP